MPHTKQSIFNNTKLVLKNYKHIIDSSEYWKLDTPPTEHKIVIDSQNSGYIFQWPSKVPLDTVGGYKLKDGKGYICLSETYIQSSSSKLSKVAHVYRYIDSDAVYHMSSSSDVEGVIKNYGFHLDEDLTYDNGHLKDKDRHPETHLQVMHSHPRFATQENLLLDFLKMVERTCFDDSGESYSQPVYAINTVR